MIRARELFAIVIGMIVCIGCQSHGSSSASFEGDTLTAEASLLTMVNCGDYIIAEVKNPWDKASVLATYALVPREAELLSLPKEVKVIRTPIKSALVYSSVHAGAMKELGAIDAVTGVADASYYKIPEINEGLKSGKVTDVGSSMSPTAELIATLSPEVMMVSPFENAGHGVIEKLGIPIVECADYMENTPLGRAEWIKFIGALVGEYDKADSIYRATSTAYKALAEKGRSLENKPTVIVEQLTDGVWYMPGGNSYHARLITDAGGKYPWADDQSAGSLQLNIEKVLDRAENADVWLIKSFGIPLTRDLLAKNNGLYKRIKAFRDNNVYYCDTQQSMLFEEFPFHPDRLLSDYYSTFLSTFTDRHPPLRYFQKAN